MKARVAALATLILAACEGYSAPDSVVFGSLVVTQRAQTVDWNAYRSYSIDPTVVVVDGTGTVMTSCSVDGGQLVPTIKANMDARGYEQAPWNPTGGADLQIKMSAFLGSQDVYYADWCSWYSYYYCYPGWTYAGSYSFGTLVVDMGDVLHAGPPTTPPGKLPLVWTNANYGVLASYYAGCAGNGNNVSWSRIQESIDRAFAQSPYIQRTAP